MQRSEGEALELVRRHVRWLRGDAESYDRGDQSVALRMAVSIRVLVHRSPTSTPALDLAGLDQVRVIDTASVMYAKPLDAIPGRRGWPRFLRLQMGPEGAAYLPRLDDGGRYPMIPIDQWWNAPIDRHPDGSESARRDYVLSLANREGGAHVDARIDPTQQRLERDGVYEWQTRNGEPFLAPMVAPCVRQVAYELLRSLEPRL